MDKKLTSSAVFLLLCATAAHAAGPTTGGTSSSSSLAKQPVAATSKKNPVLPQTKPAVAAASSASSESSSSKPEPLRKTYSYQADRYRDPFIPLIGAESKSDTGERTPQITSLTLKGILQDANGRMAVLTTGINSYILKGGRLYDAHNRAVKGISGVVKTNSVMLIGSDRTVKELRITKPVAP